MPAGRIFNASQMPMVRRRRYKRPSRFRKAVASIAKKTLMRQVESKIAVQTINNTFGTNGLLLQSGGAAGLFNGIVQGTGSANRVGDKVKVMGVKFRLPLEIDPAIVTARRENITYRVIVATNKQRDLTSADFPTYGATTDPELMTVLSDRYLPAGSTRWTYVFQRYMRWNRIAKFVGTQCIGKNLYFYVVPSTLPTGATTTTGYGVSGTVEIFFKDP